MHPQRFDNDQTDRLRPLAQIGDVTVGRQEVNAEIGGMGRQEDAVADFDPGEAERLHHPFVTGHSGLGTVLPVRPSTSDIST